MNIPSIKYDDARFQKQQSFGMRLNIVSEAGDVFSPEMLEKINAKVGKWFTKNGEEIFVNVNRKDFNTLALSSENSDGKSVNELLVSRSQSGSTFNDPRDTITGTIITTLKQIHQFLK